MSTPQAKSFSLPLIIGALSFVGVIGLGVLLGGIYLIVRSTAAAEREKLVETKDEILEESPKALIGSVDGILGEMVKTAEGLKDDVAEEAGRVAEEQARLTPEDESLIGDALAQQLLAEQTLDRNPARVRRVKSQLDRILAIAPTRFETVHIGLIDSDVVNAFAMPGGYFFVYRGLLDAIGDDDEQLLFVLAHEVGHCNLGHTTRNAAILVLAQQSQVPGALGGLVMSQAKLAYSERQEFAADAYACEIVTKLGVSLDSGVRTMATLERANPGGAHDHGHGHDEERETGAAEAATGALRRHFETHPPSDERARRIKAWKAKASTKG